MNKLIPNVDCSLPQSLGYVLHLNTAEAWFGLIPILKARLSERERVQLAFIAFKSLKAENAETVAGFVVRHAGMPIAPLFNHMDEAAFWSDMASPGELEAYCLASFTKMPAGRQDAFLDYVSGRVSA